MTPRAPGWVYLISDRRRLLPSARTTAEELRALVAQLEEATAAGVDVIQLRERDLEAAVLASLAERIVRRAAGTHTRVLVNDRADVAIASAAHGVHLRADGPPARRVRSIVPPPNVIGRSTHTVDDVVQHDDADYLLFGSIFPTASKPDAAPAAGIDRLREAAHRSPVPVIAIGGIDADRAAACVEAGAAGVAAIGAFLPEGRAPGALGAGRAVAALRAALARAVRS